MYYAIINFISFQNKIKVCHLFTIKMYLNKFKTILNISEKKADKMLRLSQY